jgi:hypothetical protein
MNHGDDVERAIAELHLTTKAETDERILGDAFVALGGAVQEPQPETAGNIWRTIMTSRAAVPAAVAAVILVAFALFFNLPSRRAVTVARIYGALGKVENIQISKFQAGQADPDRQLWASETLRVKLFKSGSGNQEQLALWDISNRVKMTAYLSSVQTETITEQMLAELEQSTARFSGLVPFSDMSDVPEGAHWNRVDDPEVAAIAPGTEAYELTWMEAVARRKWRVFVDVRTNLPKRAEFYAKLKPEDDYTIETITVVAYPSESEIQALVENIFGRPGDPVYRGTPGTDR